MWFLSNLCIYFFCECVGEIPTVAGSVSVGGRVAYCAQQPWIMNAPVRENITFGKPYEAERYQRVIEACALVSDFEILPGGDQVGSRVSRNLGDWRWSERERQSVTKVNTPRP